MEVAAIPFVLKMGAALSMMNCLVSSPFAMIAFILQDKYMTDWSVAQTFYDLFVIWQADDADLLWV
jgi:hypothetical protein